MPHSNEASRVVLAKPRHVENPANCFFYHTMDLPGLGEVKGHWDLRGNKPFFHSKTNSIPAIRRAGRKSTARRSNNGRMLIGSVTDCLIQRRRFTMATSTNCLGNWASSMLRLWVQCLST